MHNVYVLDAVNMSLLYISESIQQQQKYFFVNVFLLIPTYEQWDHVVNTYVRGLRKQNVRGISSTASIYNVIICACPEHKIEFILRLYK